MVVVNIQRERKDNSWSWDHRRFYETRDLLDLIQKSSSRYTDNPYLIPSEEGIGQVSFSDLERMTHSMDRYLATRGIEIQKRIAVIYPNSTLMALLYLTIIGAGRVLIPINPKSGQSEIEYILETTRPELIIGSGGTASKIAHFEKSRKIIVHDTAKFMNELFADPGDASLILPSDPVAEIVFTSGTMGNPKGVVLTHRNLLADSFGIGTMFHFSQSMNFLTTTPMFHNSGQIPTTTVPLWCGGTSTPIRPELGLIKFDYYVNRYNSNWSFVTPSFLAFLISSAKTEDISSLDGLFVGGAKLSPVLMEQFESRFGIPLYEAYGLTETTSFATCVQRDISLRRPGSAGVPLFINELKISDPRPSDSVGHSVGEILIRGENVFREYLDLPELTSEKMKGGWFHSGDLGYMEQDYLYVIDRIDNMILVGGENVYPTEIERLVPQMKGVVDGVLTSRPHTILGNELVLVYEAEVGVNENPVEWKRMFGQHISNFKVPSVFIEVRELGQATIPRADNGKVLRKKMYDLVNNILQEEAFVKMENESKLVDIIAETFNIERETISENTGMDNVPEWDSLNQLRLVMTLEEEFGISLNPEDIVKLQDFKSTLLIINKYSS